MFILVFFFYLVVCLCCQGNETYESVSSSQLNRKSETLLPGSLSKDVVYDIAKNIKSHQNEFNWFAKNTQFFNFQSHDNITLQGYSIEPTNKENVDRKSDIVLFFAGYTETTIKYVKYLQFMSSLGYRIFSFDHRGQGFSGLTAGGYDHGSVSYITSINDSYVKDLEIFIDTYVNPTLTSGSQLIYTANSLSGLVGLTYHLSHPTVFNKMILFTPCIRPYLPVHVEYIVYILYYLGELTGTDSKVLAARFGRNVTSDDLFTHVDTNKEMWETLRHMFPTYLILAGPTFRFLHGILDASDSLFQRVQSVSADILMFQAGADVFVDNKSMNQYFIAMSGSPYSKLVKFPSAYHELLIEDEELIGHVQYEIKQFLNRNIPMQEGQETSTTTHYTNNTANVKVIVTYPSTAMTSRDSVNTKNVKNEL